MINIPGYNEDYKIDEEGNIYSYKRKNPFILSPSISRGGYKQVLLSNNNEKTCHFVHILVAICYHNHDINSELIIDHKDNDKLNCHKDNLQVTTRRINNTKDRKRIYLEGVAKVKNCERWKAQIQINKKKIHLGTFKSPDEASQAYQDKLKTLNE